MGAINWPDIGYVGKRLRRLLGVDSVNVIDGLKELPTVTLEEVDVVLEAARAAGVDETILDRVGAVAAAHRVLVSEVFLLERWRWDRIFARMRAQGENTKSEKLAERDRIICELYSELKPELGSLNARKKILELLDEKFGQKTNRRGRKASYLSMERLNQILGVRRTKKKVESE